MVSFIIVNYNGEEFLEECLESIFKQRVKKEVIVVDNASRDSSREIIKRFKVKRIYLGENMGYPYALNKGVEHSNGDYLFFLTPTTYLKEDISPLMDDLKVYEASSPLLLNLDGKVILSIRKIPEFIDFVFLLTGLSFLFKNSSVLNRWKYPEFDYSKKSPAPQPMSACLLLRKDVFLSLGGFDDHFFLYFSDVDFFKRFYEKGFWCVFDPKVKAFYIRGGITEKDRMRRVRYFHRDMIFYLKKHHSFWIFLAFLSVVVFSLRILLLKIKLWTKRL